MVEITNTKTVLSNTLVQIRTIGAKIRQLIFLPSPGRHHSLWKIYPLAICRRTLARPFPRTQSGADERFLARNPELD